jgi:hypothetical protein
VKQYKKCNSKRGKNNNKIKDKRHETRKIEKGDSAIKTEFSSMYNSAHSLSENKESTL